MPPELRIPNATYRLQFNRQFRFKDARGLVDYLHRLGASDLYASPLVQARRGSQHGYDVTDPSRLNCELGGEPEFEALAQALQKKRMGLLLDIVPNHMAASSENWWWRDVLESGRASPFADYFDIDWSAEPQSKIVLPILGAPYGRALENQELRLASTEDGLELRYYDHALPLNLPSYLAILEPQLNTLRELIGPNHPALQALHALLDAIRNHANSAHVGRAQRHQQRLERVELKRRLAESVAASEELSRTLDHGLEALRGRRGHPSSFDPLHRLLEQQYYRLAFWRTGNQILNYRRFFNISDLASLRVERREVFHERHAVILKLVEQGQVTGLRIDHIDGLRDPSGYLERLQRSLAGRSSEPPTHPPFYVVVEKILTGEEALPTSWPVHGTTGYDFLNTLNGIFVDPSGLKNLQALHSRFTGSRLRFEELVQAKRCLVIDSLFPVEMRALCRQLLSLAAQDRFARDYPPLELERALREITSCFPLYRTYTRDFAISVADRHAIRQACDAARRRDPNLQPAALEFVRRVLLLRRLDALTEPQQQARLDFVLRWQQLTGPIMAKSLEDTAFYAYSPLLSVNEVGGDPAAGAAALDTFHRRLQARRMRWPHSLNASSTHDTKRGEDVRARLNLLSELSGAWALRLRRWSRWNRPKKPIVHGAPVPDPDMEMQLYQTLLGAWPLEADRVPAFRERLLSTMIKAAREAKIHTRWRQIDAVYESALREFIEAILRPSSRNKFLRDFLSFQQRLAHFGAGNGLAQVVLKIAAPGIPDFYQGSELWDLRLVDPDNRRAVGFHRRVRMLESLERELAADRPALLSRLLCSWPDSRIKLFVTWQGLELRRARARLFRDGDYLPLEATGRHRACVCAFARRAHNAWVVAAVPRRATRLLKQPGFPIGAKTWGNTAIALPEQAPTRWRSLFPDRAVESRSIRGRNAVLVGELFEEFPVALLSAG